MEDEKQVYPEHLIHSAGRMAYITELTLFAIGIVLVAANAL